MVETRRLTELVARVADRVAVPERGSVLALSGGADSAALGYVMKTRGVPFRCLHVDHGLADSPAMEKAARAVADTIGCDLAVLRVEVPAGASPEGRSRSVRYQALHGALDADETLLTAHTRDDQAETVLMNLLRGSGTKGLAGIPGRQGRVIRPLLDVTRSETRELATLAGLPFVDDPTNLDPAIRRNAIRLEVLPGLAGRFNPRLAAALARTARHLADDEELLEAEAHRVGVVMNDGEESVAAAELLTRPRPVADRVLRGSISRLRPPHPPTSAEMEAVWDVIGGKRRRAELAGGVEVARSGPMLRLRRGMAVPTAPTSTRLTPGAHRVGRLTFEVELVDRVCLAAPVGTWGAIFAPSAEPTAVLEGSGRVRVEVGGVVAGEPGRRRHAVAWYEPGTAGYLSVFATEESGWTSSP